MAGNIITGMKCIEFTVSQTHVINIYICCVALVQLNGIFAGSLRAVNVYTVRIASAMHQSAMAVYFA